MKLLPFLLYLVALGLFGLAGWTVYQMLPMWKAEVRTEATGRGQTTANTLLLNGRAQGQRSTAWVYSKDTADWWASFKTANLIGKPPPAPPTEKPPEPPPPPPVDVRPLDQLIELVSLVYDGQHGGRGGNSHVVLRFKQDANVEPPEWWLKANPPPGPGGPAASRPRDAVPTPPNGRPAPTARPPAARPPTGSQMPTSSAGREYVQHLWVDDGGDPRRSAVLWPVKAADGREMGKIRLVGVRADATSAFFARELPPAKPGDPPQIKEEELIKTNANLSQEVLRATRELQGRSMPAGPVASAIGSGPAVPDWVDVNETTASNGRVNIGNNDEREFAQNPDRFLEQLNFQPYVSKDRSISGLVLKGIDSKIGARFGVSAGEVLIEINGKAVKSRADAYSTAKADYERGVRTFNSKWYVNGQVVERVYQVPNKKK
jgi:hypothetical protein